MFYSGAIFCVNTLVWTEIKKPGSDQTSESESVEIEELRNRRRLID